MGAGQAERREALRGGVLGAARGLVDGHLPVESVGSPRTWWAPAARSEQATHHPPVGSHPDPAHDRSRCTRSRNNRNVGHVGGDVDPNHMDAVCVLQMSKWIVAEFVRVPSTQMPIDAAVDLVDALGGAGDSARLEGRREEAGAEAGYHPEGPDAPSPPRYRPSAVAESDLVVWTERKDAAVYRRDILRPLHRVRLIEYDPEKRTARISPSGADYVERAIIGSAT